MQTGGQGHSLVTLGHHVPACLDSVSFTDDTRCFICFLVDFAQRGALRVLQSLSIAQAALCLHRPAAQSTQVIWVTSQQGPSGWREEGISFPNDPTVPGVRSQSHSPGQTVL